jgi:hypothetical protein
MEHSTVVMIADCPEIMDALVKLNKTVLVEAVRCGTLSVCDAEKQQGELDETRERLLGMSDEHRNERLQMAFDRSKPSTEEREPPKV